MVRVLFLRVLMIKVFFGGVFDQGLFFGFVDQVFFFGEGVVEQGLGVFSGSWCLSGC